MRVAILGANSELAKDLVIKWLLQSDDSFDLYSRRPAETALWIHKFQLARRARPRAYDEIDIAPTYDVLLNFVGVGNPSKLAELGSTIVDITLAYDQLALDYLVKHRDCRYLFISSGAVFGTNFDSPVGEGTKAQVAVNPEDPSDWYAIAKLMAECRHRSLTEAAIVDVRVYSYFSHTQDMSATYLMAEVARSIKNRRVLVTRNHNVVRDYIAPVDFAQLVQSMAMLTGINMAVDCYSREPIDKFTLLEFMRAEFGLQYEIEVESDEILLGQKKNYFSLDRRAGNFGYMPQHSSLESIATEMQLLS